MGWWVAERLKDNPAELVSWVVIVIGSIVLHELAHGWAAIRAGDRTPIELGHMTWNPIVHMGPWSLLAFALFGLAWGAMPVNPSRFRRWDDRAFVAAAGPGMNLLLALVAILALAAWAKYASLASNFGMNVAVFFSFAAYLNLTLMMLNLIPVPPLDGWTILSTYFPGYARLFAGPQGPAIATGALILLIVFGGRHLFGVAVLLTNRAADAVRLVLP